METNFKVDVPSFALGYSTGKKNAKKPILTELTVTENGVYDEPVIGGAPDFSVGKTVTFKETFTPDDIPPEYHSTGVKILENGIALVQDGEVLIELDLVSPTGEHMMFGYFTEATATQYGVPTGWIQFLGEGSFVQAPPPSMVIPDVETAESLKNISFLFAGEPTPADGWNKVTVNVAGDIIDVPELPTENIEEGKIYRVTNGDTVTYAIPNAHPVKRLVDGAWVELT